MTNTDQPIKHPTQSEIKTSTTPTGGTKQEKDIGIYHVEVIREKCISAGSCVAIAPKVFELDEEDLAIVISQDGNDDQTKLLAAQSCPTHAVIVTNTQTGEQVWPPVF